MQRETKEALQNSLELKYERALTQHKDKANREVRKKVTALENENQMLRDENMQLAHDKRELNSRLETAL